MGHRLEPRGGAKNEQPDLISEAYEEKSLLDELLAEARDKEFEARKEYGRWGNPEDCATADTWLDVIEWLESKR